MGGGGVAGFDVDSWKYLGTIYGEKPTPRHLVISKDGQWLYMSSNRAGYVSKSSLANVVSALRGAEGKKVKYTDWKTLYVGSGARTIEISEDGTRLFAAINNSAELVVIDAINMTQLNRIRTDSYAVGLAVSKDIPKLGQPAKEKGGGGNSVCVYSKSRITATPQMYKSPDHRGFDYVALDIIPELLQLHCKTQISSSDLTCHELAHCKTESSRTSSKVLYRKRLRIQGHHALLLQQHRLQPMCHVPAPSFQTGKHC